jgi:hypothetical protein
VSDLPPPNCEAHGLHLTDREFEGLISFCRLHEVVAMAWVYGSRRSGRRRQKPTTGPPDIDLAVQLALSNRDPLLIDPEISAMLRLRFAATTYFMFVRPDYGLTTKEGEPGFVQIEFPKLEGGKVGRFIEAEGATLIFER